NLHDVFVVLRGGANAIRVLFFPILHEETDDSVTLFAQERCRDGRVHAAGHADDHSRRAPRAQTISRAPRAQTISRAPRAQAVSRAFRLERTPSGHAPSYS